MKKLIIAAGLLMTTSAYAQTEVLTGIRKIRMRQKWLELYAETGSVTKTALQRCV